MLKSNPVNPPTVLTGLQGGRVAVRPVRLPVTMWGLLVWAYKRELVRVADGRGSASAGEDWADGGGSMTGRACRVLETGLLGPGHNGMQVAGGGAPSFKVHADAEWVHGLVCSLARDEFWLIVRSAEAGEPPEWNPYLEPLRIEPVLRGNGRPAMIVDPMSKRPVACRIRSVGVPEDEAAATRVAARNRYAQWHRLLVVMRDRLLEDGGLTRWELTGIGAEPQPWIGR